MSDRVTSDDDPVRREELLHPIAGDKDAVGLFAQQDIAFTRKRVALVDKRRYPFSLRRPQHGKAGVSSYPDDGIGPESAQDTADLEEAADELEGQTRILYQRASVEARDIDAFDQVPRLGDLLHFHPAFRSDE